MVSGNSKSPELSVIVVSLDDPDEIPSIRSLRSQAFEDFEVIVRDDEGICTARNAGIKEASADKIVFIDDDAYPRDGYLEAASEALDDHEIVAGRVIHPRDDVISEFVDHYDQGLTGKTTDTIVGCNMAFKKEVFESVGYFDENLEWGHDETELADRAMTEYDIYYEPEMVVEHLYADGVLDYWEKMYHFGPADLYYGSRRRNGSATDGILSLIGPSAFFSSSLYGTIVKTVGRIIRNTSIVASLLRRTIESGQRE
jgi:GT2 family glycosyltransferase